MIGPHSIVIVKCSTVSTQMRREPRRSKGHTDNSRSAQAAALAATGLATARRRQHLTAIGLSTGHSAQAAALAATGLSTGHSAQATELAAAIAAARRRQHWPQQASALATARRRQHWPQQVSALATARRPQMQEAGIGFHSIQYLICTQFNMMRDRYTTLTFTVNKVHSLNSITYSIIIRDIIHCE